MLRVLVDHSFALTTLPLVQTLIVLVFALGYSFKMFMTRTHLPRRYVMVGCKQIFRGPFSIFSLLSGVIRKRIVSFAFYIAMFDVYREHGDVYKKSDRSTWKIYEN